MNRSGQARRWKLGIRVGPLFYHLLRAAVSRWPLRLVTGAAPDRLIDGIRVGYYRIRFPELTETFVRREIESLREAGLDLEVFAELPGDTSPDPCSPSGPVHYLEPADQTAGRALLRRSCWTRPWAVMAALIFTIRHSYRVEKAWHHDKRLFHEAVRLAGAFRLRRVTHAHSAFADRGAATCLIAARLLGIPCSVQARASELHRAAETKAALERLQLADFVVTNSHYNEQFLKRRLNGNRPPIHVIYNGLDLVRFQPRLVETEPSAPNAIRIISVGRLIEPKGFRYLLQAIAQLRQRGIDATAEIIGGPSDELDSAIGVELRVLHYELGLAPFVRFTGSQPFSQVLLALERAEAFALPCVAARSGSHDITPNSLIEAMALGLPVVSTTSGAIPEIVESGVSGLLVAPGDTLALADALERLARDPSLRVRLGRAARCRVEQRFNGARNVEQRLALFGRGDPGFSHGRVNA